MVLNSNTSEGSDNVEKKLGQDFLNQILKIESNPVVAYTLDWLGKGENTVFSPENPISKKDPESIKQFITHAKRITKHLIEEVDEMIEAIENGDEMGAINAIGDLLVVANNLTFYAGILPRAIDIESKAIYLSNNTKHIKTIEIANEAKEAYEAGTHPNKLGIVIKCREPEKVKGIYFVKSEEGKILKPTTFEDVEKFRLKSGLIATKVMPTKNIKDYMIYNDNDLVDQAYDILKDLNSNPVANIKAVAINNNTVELSDGTSIIVLPELISLLQDEEAAFNHFKTYLYDENTVKGKIVVNQTKEEDGIS